MASPICYRKPGRRRRQETGEQITPFDDVMFAHELLAATRHGLRKQAMASLMFYTSLPMPDHNPYSAPQITEHVIKTTVAPVNRRKRQYPWEEPLRTKLLTIARLQRAMMRFTAVLTLATIAIGAWVVTQQRDFPSTIAEGLVLFTLSPLVLMLVFTVYQLVALLEDGDSPLFLALAVLVPGFNLLLIFYVDNLAVQYLRESEIASGWLGITPEQFAAQLELLQAASSTPQAAASLPVAEAVDPG